MFWMPLRADDSQLVVPGDNNSIYTVSGRYDDTGKNDYIHITKMDANGNTLWFMDANPSANLKAVSVGVNNAGLVVLAVRDLNNYRTLELLQYSDSGYLLWDRVFDDSFTNLPVALSLDLHGNIYACGSTKSTDHYKARLWKYSGTGVMLWAVDYDPGGNTYAQQLQMLFDGTLSLGVTVYSGSSNYGQYARRVVTYSSAGSPIRN